MRKFYLSLHFHFHEHFSSLFFMDFETTNKCKYYDHGNCKAHALINYFFNIQFLFWKRILRYWLYKTFSTGIGDQYQRVKDGQDSSFETGLRHSSRQHSFTSLSETELGEEPDAGNSYPQNMFQHQFGTPSKYSGGSYQSKEWIVNSDSNSEGRYRLPSENEGYEDSSYSSQQQSTGLSNLPLGWNWAMWWTYEGISG